MEVTDVQFKLDESSNKKSKVGYANITFSNVLVVKYVQLMLGKYGYFLRFPNIKGSDDEYHDIVYAKDKVFRESLLQRILAEAGLSSEPKEVDEEEDLF